MDWFYGFQLHRVINDRGDGLGLRLTPGNVDDRPVAALVRGLWGQRFGDRGYLSQALFAQLFANGKRKAKNSLRRCSTSCSCASAR